MKKEVPIWEKSNLTIEEAAAYFNIGENKLRKLAADESCTFVLWVGSKCLIKKTLFDLRIYLTPSSVGQLMVGPTGVIHKTETGFDTTWVCDLCAYPFGFILNLSPQNPVEYGASLMDLFDTEYGKAYDMTWTLTYLERTSEELPLPLVFKKLNNNHDG